MGCISHFVNYTGYSCFSGKEFLQVKVNKTYLWTTMSQERLSGLAMISIEKEYLDKLNYDNLIEEFASKNVRRSNFLGAG